MISNTTIQLSNEFESAISEILPDLAQLLQQYQVSKTLEVDLEPEFLSEADMAICTCCMVNGFYKCRPAYNPHRAGENTLGLDPEQEQQLSKDIELKLSAILPRLRQSVKQADEIFAVHFLIDPAKADSSQPVVCQWVSDASQGNILHCSSL